MGIFKRIPQWNQIAPVYSVIVLVVYGWTILWFFWQLPSWRFFLDTGEILSALAYSLATNFLESLVAICALLIFCIILPRKWFYESFIARGTSLSMLGLGGLIYLAFQIQDYVTRSSFSYRLSTLAVGVVVVLAAAFALSEIRVLRKVLEIIADRTTIFLYLFLPASFGSILFLLIRWIF